MAKARQMKPELIATEFIKTPAGSILAALGIGVLAFPYAVEYVVRVTTDKGGQGLAYLLGAIWKGVTGKVGEAEDLIAANAKWTADKLKEIKADKWHEVNPDFTTADIDLPTVPGTSDRILWIDNMKLPDSSVLLKKPADQDVLNAYKNSGKFNYYGIFTIKNNQYWLVVPKEIELYRIIKYKQFTTARQPEFCEQNYENFTEYPACYDEKEARELVWPTRWPGTTTI